jgi:hypothetical protein
MIERCHGFGTEIRRPQVHGDSHSEENDDAAKRIENATTNGHTPYRKGYPASPGNRPSILTSFRPGPTVFASIKAMAPGTADTNWLVMSEE